MRWLIGILSQVKRLKTQCLSLIHIYNKVEKVVREVLTADKRILNDPAPFIALHALDASSVNVVVRVWVESSDYWGVYFDINKTCLLYTSIYKNTHEIL